MTLKPKTKLTLISTFTMVTTTLVLGGLSKLPEPYGAAIPFCLIASLLAGMWVFVKLTRHRWKGSLPVNAAFTTRDDAGSGPGSTER